MRRWQGALLGVLLLVGGCGGSESPPVATAVPRPTQIVATATLAAPTATAPPSATPDAEATAAEGRRATAEADRAANAAMVFATQTEAARPTDTPIPTDTPLPATATPIPPLRVQGSGTKNSKTFTLAGNYTVNWSAVADTGRFGGGNFIVHLRSPDDAYFTGVVNEIIPNQGKMADSTELYNVPAGNYYLQVIAPATWVLEFVAH